MNLVTKNQVTWLGTVIDMQKAREERGAAPSATPSQATPAPAPTRIRKLSAARLAALGSGFDNDEDDDVLVERIALGDEQALDALRERHAERCYAIASRMLDSDTDARRIVDRVFGDVSVTWPPARGTVTRWLARLTRARCRRRRRAVYRGALA